MAEWNPNTLQYEDDLEQHDTYLSDIHTDLAATAKGNANTGAPGKHLRANFSEGRRKMAAETGQKLRGGGMTEEIHSGNDLFGPMLP